MKNSREAVFMEAEPNLQHLVLELVEPHRETEPIEVLVTSVDLRLLGPIISRLKACSMCQLPFSCGRVCKSRLAPGEQVAELCICAGRGLVDTVLKEMTAEANSVGSSRVTDVTTILREVQAVHSIQLSLFKRMLGDTWPITRCPKRTTIWDVVSSGEKEYLERCIALLTSHSTVVVASPSTSFLAVIKGDTPTKCTESIQPQGKISDMLCHPVYTAIEQAMKQAAEDDKAYLLTGYDVFALEEPCIFCSMCLLHARVKRVFYSTFMGHNGGLNESLMVPSLQGVNHRFPVIKFRWSEVC
ncbi:Cytosine/adenosine deaminase [Giardia duodenalis]|uniref:Cytosine/adenosine deaminase n=1 Tax=Giardia intestinalis TaxID=5741 RepID=V6T9D0_GIAIN|nr:Cytosine/adenosine deaminase [Giardia intestinalis]